MRCACRGGSTAGRGGGSGGSPSGPGFVLLVVPTVFFDSDVQASHEIGAAKIAPGAAVQPCAVGPLRTEEEGEFSAALLPAALPGVAELALAPAVKVAHEIAETTYGRKLDVSVRPSEEDGSVGVCPSGSSRTADGSPPRKTQSPPASFSMLILVAFVAGTSLNLTAPLLMPCF